VIVSIVEKYNNSGMEEFGNLMLELINDLMSENNTIYLSIKSPHPWGFLFVG